MGNDITLNFNYDLIKQDTIRLAKIVQKGTDSPGFERLENIPKYITININKKTGEPIVIYVLDFKNKIKEAIKYLRDNPLPWTFSIPRLKIKEKPLEDVLLAIWKKYRNIKMEWE